MQPSPCAEGKKQTTPRNLSAPRGVIGLGLMVANAGYEPLGSFAATLLNVALALVPIA
jgi:hypothetical protein